MFFGHIPFLLHCQVSYGVGWKCRTSPLIWSKGFSIGWGSTTCLLLMHAAWSLCHTTVSLWHWLFFVSFPRWHCLEACKRLLACCFFVFKCVIMVCRMFCSSFLFGKDETRTYFRVVTTYKVKLCILAFLVTHFKFSIV